jgi:hypothetical protein
MISLFQTRQPGTMMRSRFSARFRRLLFTVLLGSLLAPAGELAAQSASLPTAIEYEYARPGQPTMTVLVLGQVAQPGRWRVERDVDFVDFLTAVRPLGAGMDLPETSQRMNIKVYRPVGDSRALIFEGDLDSVLSGDRRAVELAEGDALMVETISRNRFGLRTAATVVGALSSLVVLIIQLSDL